MKENKKLQRGWKTAQGLFVLLAVLLIGFSAECFCIVSHAESEGKITANSAKIRKEPSTESTSLGSALKDSKVSIKGQTTGADGKIWYQVFVDADTLGYIRSDLVEITDGSVPGNVAATGGATAPADPGPDETVVVVNEVNPVSASVKGGQAVRVRQNASTTSRIVTTAQSGLVLTVTGTALGTDGNNWYRVNYISNSSEVNGFIRADYVELSGELVPVETETPVIPDPPAEDTQPTQPEPTVVKDWDTYFENDVWHLVNNQTNESYNIESIFTIAADNKETALNAIATKKKQQVVIIILVILLIGLAALVTYLVFRIRDMMDSAYFNEVERETARRRADRPQSGQKVMHTVGDDKKSSGQRPSGQRPAGSGSGQRPNGQRPAGAGGQGQRPAGGGGQGQRPGGGNGQGQRPAGAGGQGQRPGGGNGQGQRPAGAGGQGQRSGGGGQGQRPEGGAPQQKGASSEQGWKSKNFMSDDDDFKFLDWDEVEDK